MSFVRFRVTGVGGLPGVERFVRSWLGALLDYDSRKHSAFSGHDLSSPDTRFNLQLATRAWQTLVGLRG